MTITRLKLLANFDPGKQTRDKIALKAEVPLSTSFDPAGKTLTLDVGGALTSFTFDERGKAVITEGASKLKYRKNTDSGLLVAKIKIGSYASAWADEGLTDETVIDKSVTINVTVTLDGSPYSANKQMLYRARQGKKGMAR